jgi:putative phage-type endonuclease
METLSNVHQGSAKWMAIRADHFTASEAPAMMGVSKYQTRSALLKAKAERIVDAEIDPAKQRLFYAGHAAEAAARPIVEKYFGEELYPCTGTLNINGLPLLASFDGLTMDESRPWENKLWNALLVEAINSGELEPHYYWQLEQQILVCGGSEAYFTTSDGTEENTRGVWYQSRPERRDALIAGWHQFAKDLAAYIPAEVVLAPVSKPQMSLPSVSIQVNGSIALVDNLEAFGTALTAYVNRINKTPETDQDFADLEATVKTLKTAEEALDAAENGALAQTESIDSMRRTVGLYRETARTNRLLVEKLVKVEKENRRTKIIGDASAEFITHMRGLNERLGKPYLPTIQTEFQTVVKGLKSIDSMRDKVATELARCKIEANAVADKIQINLGTLRELAKDHAFLFADTGTIVQKAPDDLNMLVKSRIAEHQAEVQRKEEAQRAAIRAEELAKIERETAARADAEKKVQDAITAAQAVVVPTPAPAQSVASAVTFAEVVAIMPTPVAKAMTQSAPTLKLGQIAERLGFSLSAEFLSNLGFDATTERNAKLFRESDFPMICMRLVSHIQAIQIKQAA